MRYEGPLSGQSDEEDKCNLLLCCVCNIFIDFIMLLSIIVLKPGYGWNFIRFRPEADEEKNMR